MVDGGEPGVDSRDEGKHTGRIDLLIRKEDDVDGRATVTKDEERAKDAKLRLYTFNRYELNQSDNLAAWNRIKSNSFQRFW